MEIGKLYEIYSNNKDSFCVGKIICCDDRYLVFEDIDLLGRIDAHCLMRKDIISEEVSESEYLDLIRIYMTYWENQSKHEKISLKDFKFKESKNLLLQALQYAYDNNKIVKLSIDGDAKLLGGYLKELHEDSIVVSLVDWSNASIFDEVTIKIPNIRFLEFEGIEETLLNYANKTK